MIIGIQKIIKKYLSIQKDNEILKNKQGEKSMELPFFIEVEMECLLYKIYTCHNHPKMSSTTKKLSIE